MGNITDELRAWSKEHLSRSSILAIADRIDAEHERELRETGEDIVRDVRHEWVRLPLDADGVPIRVGDHVEETDMSIIGRARGEVIRTVFGKHGTDVRIDTGLSYADRNPWSLRHISKPPTIEDVLREFVSEFNRDDTELCDEEIIEQFAKKLRLAGDE